MKKRNEISPEAQEVINLFQSLPLKVQNEFRKWINDTELVNDLDFEPLEWDIEVNDTDWSVIENYFEEPIQNEPKRIKSNTKTKCIKKKTY